MNGWISIHRDIREHWIWKDPLKLKWWMDILMTVNHKPSKVNLGMQLYDCGRGQSVMSLQSWASRWGVSKDSTRNFFELLKKDGMIHTENLVKTTRLTVCHYDLYQIDLHASQTQVKRKPNAKQTQAGTNNNDNKENNKTIEEVLSLFHKSCPNSPRIKKVSKQRIAAVNARITDHGFDAIKEMLENVSKSDFLNGNNNQSWVPTFDWLFSPKQFIKVLEGNYNNRSAKKINGLSRPELSPAKGLSK